MVLKITLLYVDTSYFMKYFLLNFMIKIYYVIFIL